MATRRQALAVAAKFGFTLDETNSGRAGDCFLITFDHPTHSIAGDCRSIHVEDYGDAKHSASSCAWAEVTERLEDEGPLLQLCDDPECDYHNECEEDE